ncbi:MAG: RNA polymerase sigma factor [Sphingobacteriales bacterium]|jgi:RNA polymerase sigma factor (sigma-70 family)|nr:RNA polymerase sigma factor [Sphingobacteriales bacterium]
MLIYSADPIAMSQQDQNILDAFQTYRKRLFDFIRLRVKETADAEDILQDVFYELSASYRILVPVEQTAAWLYRVARNKITDRYRKHKPELYEDIATGISDDGEHYSFIEELLGTGDDPGFSASDNELIRDALMKALEELPQEQREVFVGHELELKSFKDMSDAWGVPVNTLLSRKHYAIKFLRKKLFGLYKELFGS